MRGLPNLQKGFSEVCLAKVFYYSFVIRSGRDLVSTTMWFNRDLCVIYLVYRSER